MLAAAEPDRVRGLILSATFLRAPGRHLPSLRLIACGPIIWIMRTARRIPIWTLRRRDAPYRQAKAEIWRRVSARCLAKRTRAILGVDVRELSSKCEAPMLCIHFADDKVVPREFSEEILCYQPSADRHNSRRSLRIVEERRMLGRGDHALRSGASRVVGRRETYRQSHKMLNGANGRSDIEGKVTRVGARKRG